jgi:RNA polymerase sigma-70 factor (sigma-E family)
VADDGFAEFATARLGELTRVAFLLTGDEHTAEDLLQDTLILVASRWPRVAQASDPMAYLRRVLDNQLVSTWRRNRYRRAEVSTDRLLDRGGGRDEASDTVNRVVLLPALAKLTPRQRAVIVQRFFEDLGEAATAEVLGCSVGTVKSQTHRALGRLRILAPAGSRSQPGGRHTDPVAERRGGTGVPHRRVAHELPLPAGCSGESIATAGDPTGRFLVGRSYPGGGGPRILIWDRGGDRAGTYQVTLAHMPGSDASLSAVHSSGWAVGYSFPDRDDIDHTTAYSYRDGEMTPLPGGDTTQAHGIGEAGTIIGSVAGDDFTRVPVVWRSPTVEPEFLPLAAETPPRCGLEARGDWAVIWAGKAGGGWTRHVWNMSTGEVRRMSLVEAINARGWYLTAAGDGWVLASDVDTVPVPAGGPLTLSDDGRFLGGDGGTAEIPLVAMAWTCS